MSTIRAKALALPDRLRIIPDANGMMYDEYDDVMEAADLIEQHEAFKQEVSDAVTALLDRFLGDGLSQGIINGHLHQFIIPKPKPKPDPLVEVIEVLRQLPDDTSSADIIAALEARGLEIREKGQ